MPMREDEIYRLVPRRRLLAILCNIFGILCLTAAAFISLMRLPNGNTFALLGGIAGGILLGLGVLFHVSDSIRHKGRIRNLERRRAREEAEVQGAEDPEETAPDRSPEDRSAAER